MALDARTVDAVSVGEQQPEVDHKMKKENSETGMWKGKKWRDARNGGYFKYTLSTNGKQPLSLMAIGVMNKAIGNLKLWSMVRSWRLRISWVNGTRKSLWMWNINCPKLW